MPFWNRKAVVLRNLLCKEGDGCLTESEFVDLFEKVRLGYLSENEELRRALKKICSPVLIGRVSVGGGGAIDNGEDGSARGRPQVDIIVCLCFDLAYHYSIHVRLCPTQCTLVFDVSAHIVNVKVIGEVDDLDVEAEGSAISTHRFFDPQDRMCMMIP